MTAALAGEFCWIESGGGKQAGKCGPTLHRPSYPTMIGGLR